MGNPVIQIQDTQPASGPPVPTTYNGILAYVPGDVVAAGIQQLPPVPAAGEASPPRQVDLQAPGLGLVRVTYAICRYKHGRSRFAFWRAVRAETITPQ
ncbi:MAG: hypothetical protein KF686_03270 [Ramlibacter sp.]|nr:hypothetical protein [Ramlibacter sp.]